MSEIPSGDAAMPLDSDGRLAEAPNFFHLAPQAPGVIDGLWKFAHGAYFEAPLPGLFKERLFIYLSRFCEARYCITRHVGLLLGRGSISAAANSERTTIEQVLRLLRRPLPRGEASEPFVRALESRAEPIGTLPPPDSADEDALFVCLSHVFVQSPQASRSLAALRRVLNDATFQSLLGFLTFVQTSHFWTKLHPELKLDDDIVALLESNPELADCLRQDSAIRDADSVGALETELQLLRREKEESELLRRTMASIGTLADSITQLAWMADPDGHIFWYNRRWYEYTGTTLEQMQGWGWQSVHDPDVLPSVVEGWKRSLATGEAFEMIFPLQGADGVFRPFLTRVHPVKDAAGSVVRWFGTNTDISEVKRTEEELREARSRLDSTLAAAEIGTWEFDPVHNVVRADRNLARLFGVSADEAEHGTFERYLYAAHPDDRERVLATIRSALESSGKFETDFRLQVPDQRLRWVVARGRIERDAAGNAVRIPGVIVDITQQREAEAEAARLAAESERLRRLYDTVLSNTADFNYTFDLAGRFTYANKALLRLWNKSLAEAVGKTFVELDYPPELAAKLQRQIRQVIDTRRPLRDETPYAAGGDEREYEYIFVPVFGDDGKVEAVAGSTRDITDQKRVQAELREIAARLSEADRRKDEFLATLAHELRNPLAPIRAGLEVMKYAQDDPETLEEVRATMERQAQQMIRLIDDLLDMSRITQGKSELRPCRVALADVVESAVEATQPIMAEENHVLIVTLPDEPVHLHADPSRLTQVISNLLNNSSKYTPAGGRIWLSAERQGNEVVISVKDDGIGIASDMQAGIFEMFTQIDRPLEKGYKGLGIGLTLVKKLVEMHGGTVAVHSEGTGRGSEFRVRLPVLGAVEAPSKPAAPAGEGKSSQLRILVVDDNADAAKMLGMVVRMLGNEVRLAGDGLQAVQVAEEFQPRVVLMDIGMPQMNGYEAARHIRGQAWGKDMVLVALTGWGQDEDKQRASDAGFNYHLVKPAEPDDLQRLLAGLHR